jgi:hypothetical protein
MSHVKNVGFLSEQKVVWLKISKEWMGQLHEGMNNPTCHKIGGYPTTRRITKTERNIWH